MPLTPSYNLVTFEVDGGERIYLTGSQISRRGGLEPDVWQFTVPHSEWAKLADMSTFHNAEVDIEGVLKLWYSHHPDDGEEADVSLNVAIVAVDAAIIGMEPGDTAEKVMAYQLTISDHRRGFIEPRGGRLMYGPMNPTPLPDGATLNTNGDLIEYCATAMGVTVSIAGTVDDAEPIRDLDWSCAHAPSALQEILEHCGHVYAPLIAGDAQIMKPGDGGFTYPGDRLVRDITHKSIDRRPLTAIFTSAPHAKIYTFNEDADSPPAWKFVVQDPTDDKWKALADVAAITDAGGAAAVWAANFQTVAEEHRQRIQQQLYCCIQLDPETYPVRSVNLMPQAIDLALVSNPPRINGAAAEVAVEMPDGTFAPKGDTIPIIASQVLPEVNVLVFPHPIVQLAYDTATQLTGDNSSPVSEGSLKPTFSVEAWLEGKKDFPVYGFRNLGFGITTLSESAAKACLTGFKPDTAIYESPDLIQVILNPGTGETTNRSTMLATAQTYARNALRLDDLPLRELTFTGFLQVELTGAVSQVDYDIDNVRTVVTVNGWHVTSRCGGEDSGFSEGGITRNVTKNRSRSRPSSRRRAQAISTKLATNNTAKTVEPSRPQVRNVPWPMLFMVKAGAPVSGAKGRYAGTIVEWKPNVGSTGDLTAGHLGVNGAAVELWHPADINAADPTLDSGDVVWCACGPTNPATGKRIMVSVSGGGSISPDPFTLPTGTENYEVLMWISGNWVPSFPRIHE